MAKRRRKITRITKAKAKVSIRAISVGEKLALLGTLDKKKKAMIRRNARRLREQLKKGLRKYS